MINAIPSAQDALLALLDELGIARELCSGFLDESMPLYNAEQAKAAGVILSVLDLAIDHAKGDIALAERSLLGASVQ